MEELKKCPFCGREAVVIKTLCLENNFEGYHVFHNCKVFGTIRTDTFDSEEEAIKVWNRRAEKCIGDSLISRQTLIKAICEGYDFN